MKTLISGLAVAAVGLLLPGGVARGAELPRVDREALAPLLDAGVVGAPATAGPLTLAMAGLRDGTWTYQILAGKGQGQTQAHVASQLKSDATGTTWRYESGPNAVLFLHAAPDGTLSLVSEQDIEHGVLTTYAPPEPVLVPGLTPGESRQSTIAVKVYDLSEPDNLKYQGSLDVTYSYLGAYAVTVPAGSWDAALVRWTFKGKVGPARIEDTQYRFAVADVGMLARIEAKNISAMLIYHDDSKSAKVLVTQP
jgi:hypothetical protein